MTSDAVHDRLEVRGRADEVALPDRALFWRWVWSAVRPVLGWVLAGLGALALFLGWFGVSGQALTAKQLPYLVSGGLTGIGLFILAGVFLATEDVRRQLSRIAELERKVDDLHALFAVELTGPLRPPAAAAASGPFVALPTAGTFHREGCALVAGKSAAGRVDEAAIAARRLRPCRVCDPLG